MEYAESLKNGNNLLKPKYIQDFNKRLGAICGLNPSRKDSGAGGHLHDVGVAALSLESRRGDRYRRDMHMGLERDGT